MTPPLIGRTVAREQLPSSLQFDLCSGIVFS